MRECGMLLPVSSLPSRYGIGSFSKEAYEFVDALHTAGQRYWQILPLGPTGYGDSPYQSFSAFAGNPYFIDLETLIKEGLLSEEECEEVDFGSNVREIEYEKIYEGRFLLLRKAYDRWKALTGAENCRRLAQEKLGEETREYCFFMAVKEAQEGKSWDSWDEDIRRRWPDAVNRYRAELADEIGFYEFQQLKFQEQWVKLKDYANKHDVKIIGDIPIYVAFDGADAWSHPELFQFDGNSQPSAVAGCPPDAFSATGQLWGNPLYRWDYHRNTGFGWWMKRMEYSFRLYDVVRIDHFRGFDEYYSIPYGHETAEHGHWEKGPGMDLFRRMSEYFGTGELPIIAEDLGFLTPSVLNLLRETGFPGMKVLEFAFSAGDESAYLPHNYESNCVVYTGTHDNDTVRGWFENMSHQDRQYLTEYMNGGKTEGARINWDVIRLALSSVAKLAIIPVQDYLGLGSEARINEPSTLGKNWRWRMTDGELNGEILQKCRRLARIYGRF